MGAWGVDSFENDSALDWIGDLMDGDDLAPVHELFGRIGDDDELREELLAAAEVVAALNGRPSPDLPENFADWSADKAAPGPETTAQAIRAVDWVLEHSELRQLWEDAGSLAEWSTSLNELRKRLVKGPKRRWLWFRRG